MIGKSIQIASIMLLSVFLSGCFGFWAPVVPPIGAVYNQTTFPTNLNLDGAETGPYTGKASSIAVLGIISIGETGTHTAAKNGNLTTITHVDAEYKNVLFGIFQEYTTVVYGH